MTVGTEGHNITIIDTSQTGISLSLNFLQDIQSSSLGSCVWLPSLSKKE